MEIQKQKDFLIRFVYYSIHILIAIAFIKWGIPMITPFVFAFLIAYGMDAPIGFVARKTGIDRKWVAVAMVTLLYLVVGLLISGLGMKAAAFVKDLLVDLPVLYTTHLEPVLMGIFSRAEQLIGTAGHGAFSNFDDILLQAVQTLGQAVSNLSVQALGGISEFAYSLPSVFINLLLMIISTYFMAMDFHRFTNFFLCQFSDETKLVIRQIEQYVVGTLWVCIRSYALIMTITFVELVIGLKIIGVKYAVIISLVISVFDILPVVGTGGIMIPWAVLASLQGNLRLCVSLLVVYLVITIIRNILEPKIVGGQIGLHPVVTLVSMFVGVQVLGVVGLFGFPILLYLLKHLNDNGVIKLYKPV